VGSVNVELPAGLKQRLTELFPGAAITRVERLGADTTGTGETEKGLGYGRPLRVDLRQPDGVERKLVFHLAGADGYGHDRRADRAAEQLLAWDTFGLFRGHVRAVDVGAVRADGGLQSLAGAGEFYLVTEWGEGEVYAEDLRRIARTGVAEPLDLERLDALVAALVELHAQPGTHPGAYVRAWRDLVGSGEGIAGLVDGYRADVPQAPAARLAAIEHQCLSWRQRHKGRVERLKRTHGDYHPFNLVFAPGSRVPVLLDTSRGSQGEPADDVACLAINFLFFGVEHRERWSGGLGELWRRYWKGYLARGDAGVLECAAPFLAWRALVLCNPEWYPKLPAPERDRLLRLVERALAAERFDPTWGEEAMR